MQQLTHINTTGMGFFYDHNAGIQCLFYEVNLGIRYDVNAVGYTFLLSIILSLYPAEIPHGRY